MTAKQIIKDTKPATAAIITLILTGIAMTSTVFVFGWQMSARQSRMFTIMEANQYEVKALRLDFRHHVTQDGHSTIIERVRNIENNIGD